MSIALSALGVAFAAFCIWLTVRLVNRGENPMVATQQVLAVLSAGLGGLGLLIVGGMAFYLRHPGGDSGTVPLGADLGVGMAKTYLTGALCVSTFTVVPASILLFLLARRLWHDE